MSFIYNEEGKKIGAKPKVIDTPNMKWVGYPKSGYEEDEPVPQEVQEDMGSGGFGGFDIGFGGGGFGGSGFGGGGFGGGGQQQQQPSRRRQNGGGGFGGGFGGILDDLNI